MDRNELLKKLKPYQEGKPYIFISYRSEDQEVVWADVLRFQQDGYNIWLDEMNLDKTKPSWKDDALKAINSRYCCLLLFYVSASSLCSDNCLRELQETTSTKTKMYHNKEVPFVAIDVEPIGNIIDFCNSVHQKLQALDEPEQVFNVKAEALYQFREGFFNGNNERIRVHPKDEPARKGDYYTDIEQNFPDEARISSPVVSTEPPTAEIPIARPTAAEVPAAEAPMEWEQASLLPKQEAPAKRARVASVTGDVTYTLYGKEYTNNQSDLMCQFFFLVLLHHPERAADLPLQPYMNCVSHVDYEKEENRGPDMPTYFRTCRTLSFPDGSSICVGTSYGLGDKLKKMAALLDICDENREVFSSQQVALPELGSARRGRPAKDNSPSDEGKSVRGKRKKSLEELLS